jgi:hypothetical protein
VSKLRVPVSWADDHARTIASELFAPCPAEQAEVSLSYAQEAGWLAEHQPDDVAEDLMGGMLVEQRFGNDGPYYRLAGTRLVAFAKPREAKHSRVPQAHVTSVKRAWGIGRAELVRPRIVRLSLLKSEEYCDLAELHDIFADGLTIARRRRSVRDRIRHGLARTNAAPQPRGDLHTHVRRRYQPLLQMLELLEQRSRLEGEIRGSGVVLGEAELGGQPVLWLRVD